MSAVSRAKATATRVAAAPALPGRAPGIWAKLLRVAWLSIALGIAIELLLLVAATLSGGLTAKGLIADLVQKVSWSFVVCMGLALGTAAAKMRSEVMGLLGALSAPLGFVAARTLHKAVGQALGLGIAAGGASPFVIAALKAVECALLGALLGALPSREQGRTLTAHVFIGSLVGLVFGSGTVGVMAQHAAGAVDLAFVLPKAINEVLFPLGCSLVLYAVEATTERLR